MDKTANLTNLEVENPRLELENSKGAMIADFFASWCGPCKMMSPVIERIYEKYSPDLKVIKVDIDKHGELSSEYQIQSVPTILFFVDGKVVGHQVGLISESKLCDMIDSQLITKK